MKLPIFSDMLSGSSESKEIRNQGKNWLHNGLVHARGNAPKSCLEIAAQPAPTPECCANLAASGFGFWQRETRTNFRIYVPDMRQGRGRTETANHGCNDKKG